MENIRADAQKLIDSDQEPTQDMEQQLDALLQQVQVNPAYQGRNRRAGKISTNSCYV